MTRALLSFPPLALLLTISPGPDTVLVLRASISAVFLRKDAARRSIEAATGGVLIAFGVRTALARR